MTYDVILYKMCKEINELEPFEKPTKLTTNQKTKKIKKE